METVHVIGYIDDNGQLHTSQIIQLPPGKVEIIIQTSASEDMPLTSDEIADALHFEPADGAALARDPAIGIWADRTDMDDPVAYLEQRRNQDNPD